MANTSELKDLAAQLNYIVDEGGELDEYQRGVLETVEYVLGERDQPNIAE